MAEEAKEIQFIDWRRTFAFLEILRSFRIAIHPVKIILCFIGLAASVGVGVAVDQIPWVGQTNVRVSSSPVAMFSVTGPEVLNFSTEAAPQTSFLDNVREIGTHTLWGRWAMPYVNGKSWGDFADFAMTPVTAARQSIELIIAYWQEAWLFALINTILLLAIWAVVGTAVSRMAAVRIAREESVPMGRALGFAFRKWPSAVMSPLLPFGVLVMLAAVVGALAGLPMNIPYAGEIVVGLLWGVVLAVGFLLAMIFIGGTFSVGLQWSALAVEGSDSFDAISRSVSYISSRPWRYIFYGVFSTVYGCLTFVLVKFVAFLTLFISHVCVGLFTFAWGSGGVDAQTRTDVGHADARRPLAACRRARRLAPGRRAGGDVAHPGVGLDRAGPGAGVPHQFLLYVADGDLLPPPQGRRGQGDRRGVHGGVGGRAAAAPGQGGTGRDRRTGDPARHSARRAPAAARAMISPG